MSLLDQLSVEIKKNRPLMQNKQVLRHQDSAPCHKSMKTMVRLNELCFELLCHPAYSPDLEWFYKKGIYRSCYREFYLNVVLLVKLRSAVLVWN